MALDMLVFSQVALRFVCSADAHVSHQTKSLPRGVWTEHLHASDDKYGHRKTYRR